VQVRLAEELDLAVGLDVAASDGLVERDRVGPLLRRAVAQLAPLPIGVERARYCESRVTIGQDGGMSEIPLPGGFLTAVVRVGDTVRRPRSRRASFVHQLLELFARHGWAGAPRFLGIDAQGREILSFIDGHVAWEPAQPREVCSDESLARVAELVRQFHDLTSGTLLAGGQEVVCHNDLSPKNTVYRDLGRGLRPVAFLDWDLAAPGRRLHDVAHVCWQYLDLGPSVIDTEAAVRRLRLLCDAYGLADRAGLVETVLWWQDRCWRGIDAEAAAGDAAMIALRDGGVVAQVQAAWRWVAAHRHKLEAGIR
jgi:Phosphotransferase enzyme family